MLPQTPKPPKRVQLEGKRGHFVYEPEHHIGQVGHLELWSARYPEAVAKKMRWYFATILGFDRDGGVYASRVELYETSLDASEAQISSRACVSDLGSFSKAFGVRSDRAVVIGSSYVAPHYRKRGLGVAMYVAAAALARSKSMAIVADACTEEGRTSEDAMRVWSSRAFHHQVRVGRSGIVAVYKT